MFEKDVKNRMVNEYKQELNNYQPMHIERMIDLYEMVVNYPVSHESIEGLQKKLNYSINKLFSNSSDTTDEELEMLCESFFNIEPFLKKVLYIVDNNKFEQLYNSHNLECAEVMIQLGLMEPVKKPDGKYNFSANPKNFLNDNRQMDHVLEAYVLRNKKAHEVRLWNRIAMFTNIQNVMLTSLYVCWKHRVKIESVYEQYDRSLYLDVDDMMKNIIDTYKQNMKNGFKFISIKWYKKELYGENSEGSNSANMSMDTIRKDIGKRNHVMLLGEAGCGKTTSIEYLEYKDAEKWRQNSNNPIPVKIQLCQATDSWFSIEDTICKKLNIPMDYCRKLLKAGGINLYLDGVNEMIASNNVKKKVVMQIEKLLALYPNAFIVITDRENVEIKIDIDMPRFYLHQMDKEEIRNYITQKIGENSECEQRLMEYVDFMEGTEVRFTPIILNFLIEYAKRHELLPETSTDFFWVYMKELFRRENEEKKDINASPGRLDALLMYLSLHMEDDGLEIYQVLRLFAKCKRALELEELDTKKCLDLSVQLGILEIEDEKYKFANMNYADCLLANALDKGMDEIDD